MRRAVIPLVGFGLFLYGLLEVKDSVHIITDTSGIIGGFVLLAVGALVLSVEMSRW